MTTERQSFTPEFKSDLATSVVEQGYTISEACKAMEVGETKIRASGNNSRLQSVNSEFSNWKNASSALN